MGTRPVVLIAAALMALTAGTCSNDDDADDSAPTTTTLSPEAEVEAAYLAYREMVTRLLQEPDPEDSELDARTADPNKAFLVDRLQLLVDQGRQLRFGPKYEYEVTAVSVDGDQATIRDCTVDDAQTVDEASGEVVSEGVTTELLEATLRQSSGQWRVVTIDGIDHWEGAVTCEE